LIRKNQSWLTLNQPIKLIGIGETDPMCAYIANALGRIHINFLRPGSIIFG